MFQNTRKVEKPQTARAKRQLLIAMLEEERTALGGQQQAASMVFGDASPIVAWLRHARTALGVAIAALDKGHR